MNINIRKNQSLLAILLLFFLLAEIKASSVCYSAAQYPATRILSLTKNKFPRIILTGNNINVERNTAPIYKSTRDGWVADGEQSCKEPGGCGGYSKKSCDVEIPKISLSEKEMLELRSLEKLPFPYDVEQNVSVCSQSGDDVFFGIEFYEGEGTAGVGGIGKYNVKTKKMEIRRLLPLRNTSVTKIVFDGVDLWISASQQYECEGTVPVVPLMRYNWDKDYIYDRTSDSLQFCGFNVYDIFYNNNTMYISSDLGFTIGYKNSEDYGDGPVTYEWQGPFSHYIYDEKDSEKMVKVSCDALYDDILNKQPFKNNRQLINSLIKFKPNYMLKKFITLDKNTKK